MHDTVHHVETPEGVDLSLRLAGHGPRLLAWLLDLIIRFAILVALAIVLSLFGRAGGGLLLVALFLLEWSYPVLWEVLANGRTPGKKALGLRVVRNDGTPVDWAGAAIRNLLRAADFLPLFNLAAAVTMAVSRRFCRLGDLAAGTVVIYDEARQQDAEVARVQPIPPPISLRLDEQRALLSFGRRAGSLSADRAQELAERARPLIDATVGPVADPKEAVVRLLGIAAWIVGRRPKGSTQ